MSVKPKVWLYENGHITLEDRDKRGRMSLANKELVMGAVANGVHIEGYDIVKANVSTGKPAEVKRVAIDPNVIADLPDMRRDERLWNASVKVDGKDKVIGFRTICNGCGNSLGWCYEENSTVWVDHNTSAVVHFTSKTK